MTRAAFFRMRGWALRVPPVVAPTPFEGWGEYPHDGTTLRLIVIVSVGALVLTLCVALLMLFAAWAS